MFNEINLQLDLLEDDLNIKSELEIRSQLLSIHQQIIDHWEIFFPEEGSLLTNKIFNLTKDLNEKYCTLEPNFSI